MRIIAGEFKGRRIKMPENYDIRPTTEKVKEAIFSMLYPYMQQGFTAADIFAGTGNLGIEAISRGASMVWFGDSSRDSIRLLNENLAYCKAQDRSAVFSGDFKSTLKRIGQPLDIIFIDPPYAAKQIPDALANIQNFGCAKPGTIAVCEHDIHDQLAESYGEFFKIKDKNYGRIAVSLYRFGGLDG